MFNRATRNLFTITYTFTLGMLIAAACTPDLLDTGSGDGSDVSVVVDDTPDGADQDAPTVTVGAGSSDVVVERVIDGDSLELVVDGEELEVRVLGINAPELYTLGDVESCTGRESGAYFEGLLEDAAVLEFVADEEDRFGRTLGVIYADGVAVTRSMVDAGWALALWSGEDPAMIDLMVDAAANGRGIWGSACGEPTSGGLTIADTQVNAPGDDRENINEEWVTVANEGSAGVDLSGWTIRDETTSNRFLIDDWTLDVGETVRFISGSGTNGGGDYYLGEEFPLWSNRGETVLLVDPTGVVAAYAFVDG